MRFLTDRDKTWLQWVCLSIKTRQNSKKSAGLLYQVRKQVAPKSQNTIGPVDLKQNSNHPIRNTGVSPFAGKSKPLGEEKRKEILIPFHKHVKLKYCIPWM